MMQVLPDPGPLSPHELLKLTPKEAAMLEALRGLFEAIEVTSQAGPAIKVTLLTDHAFKDSAVVPSAIIREANHHYFLTAKGLYLKLRNRHAEEGRP